MFIRLKKSYSKACFNKITCSQPPILKKKHIYKLICALIVGGELMHYEEEEDWVDEEEEDEDKSWLDDEW